MAEIYQLPENGGNNGGFGNIPFSIPLGGFGGGGLFGNGNYGMNGIADLFGLAIIFNVRLERRRIWQWRLWQC